MEKQRTKYATKSCKRLLKLFSFAVIFLVQISSGFSQNLTLAQIRALRIKAAQNQNFYTKSDIKFEVLLPNTNPSAVILQNSTISPDITLKTMRKTQEFGEVPGTKLELWYTFDKKGTFTIPPLQLFINGRQRSLTFEPVTINNNPEFLFPQIVLVFENDTRIASEDIQKSSKAQFDWQVGKKIKFIVCLQYAVQLVQFNWELPKDSIFTQTRTFEIVEIKYREKRYSEELIPVAEFEWTSLADGNQSFPKIKIVATGYNGYRKDITIPEFFINFTQETQEEVNSDSTEKKGLFDSIFEEEYFSDPNFTTLRSGDVSLLSEISLDNCETIAKLRNLEKTDLLNYFDNKAERIAYEEELGITGTEDEFYLGLFYFSLVLFVLCLIFFIFFLHKKHTFSAFLLSGLMIFSLVFFIYISIQSHKEYGISKGCTVNSIPEENAKSNAQIGAGNRVYITSKCGEWVHVQFGESSGWCKSSDIIEIKD